MPNGRLALVRPNLLDRLDAAFSTSAVALGGNVDPVGRNIAVQLLFRNDGGSETNVGGPVYTNDQGGYVGLNLPKTMTVGAPDGRFLAVVGSTSEGTITRAFVCNTSAQDNTTIDYRSEAAVRAILGKLATTPTCKLSNFSPQEICAIVDRIYAMDGSVSGNSAAAINQAAAQVVASDGEVQHLLETACDIFNTPTPRSPTRTAVVFTPTATQPKATPTTPVVVNPTATNTPQPQPTTPGTSVNTATPTATRTGLQVNVGEGSFNAQGKASISTSVVTGSVTVGGVQNDILFDNRIVKLDSASACKINEAIGTSLAGCEEDPPVGPCKTLSRQLSQCGGTPQPQGCPEGAGPEISRFRGIVAATAVPNANAIPTGALYTCEFTLVSAQLLPAVLTNSNFVVSDPLGERLSNVTAGDGLATASALTSQQADAGATTLQLASATNFPSSGAVRVRGQVVGYTLQGTTLQLSSPLAEAVALGELVTVVPAGSIPPTATPTATSNDPTATPTTAVVLTETPTVTPPTVEPTTQPTSPAPTTAVPSNTPTQTPTLTFTPTFTPTPTAGPVRIDLGMANGPRGAIVMLPVTLSNGVNRVVATANDIKYDSRQVHVVLVNGVPDCAIAEDIKIGTAADKQLVSGVLNSGNTQTLRVGVVSYNHPTATIPDGLLFTCNFQIDPAASTGQMLDNSATVSDADGNEVAAEGNDGAIGLEGSLPLVVVDDATGAAGTQVTVPARLVTGGNMISAVSVDIIYDSDRATVALDQGDPNCTIDASIGTGTAADKVLVSEVIPLNGSSRRLRVGIYGLSSPTTALSDGAIFSCKFDIAAAASGNIPLDASAAVANMSGVDAPADAADGTIHVQ